LCARYPLHGIGREGGYLGSAELLVDPLISGFEVQDVLPVDVRRLRAALRLRNVGRLEVKVRGIKLEPRELIRRLKPFGDHEATLLISGEGNTNRAVLARRFRREA
jgi:hypothetical protein